MLVNGEGWFQSCVSKKAASIQRCPFRGTWNFKGPHYPISRPLEVSHWFSRLSLLRLARVKRMEAKSGSHDDEMLSLVVFEGFKESNYGRYQEHLILTLHETSNDRQVALFKKSAPSIHFVFTSLLLVLRSISEGIISSLNKSPIPANF